MTYEVVVLALDPWLAVLAKCKHLVSFIMCGITVKDITMTTP